MQYKSIQYVQDIFFFFFFFGSLVVYDVCK